MSICVNKSHPEFRALVEQSGESTEFVAIKVADYFNTTGETDSMPTLEDIGLSKVNVVNYSLKSIEFQKLTAEEKAKTIEQVTKEHRSIVALKDLAHKLAYRIGGKVEFENKTDADWKGYNQGNTSVLNEAYMTPDTPFHEILAHPIIRAIKNGSKLQIEENLTEKDADKIIEKNQVIEKNGIRYLAAYDAPDGSIIYRYDKTIQTNPKTELYQSLLKELETGRGKEVFEQVKRDYKIKIDNTEEKEYTLKQINNFKGNATKTFGYNNERFYTENNQIKYLRTGEVLEKSKQDSILNELENKLKNLENTYYTLEEQQEEAVVQLLGLMAANKLDAKKEATLISKLKELWKQISDFVKSLLKQDGIKIDELPITTTLNDLAEIMAYGNNKIILPGYKVEYSTPLGNKYDTLEEVNNEIRGLADANAEVDLSGVKINLRKQVKNSNEIPVNKFVDEFDNTTYNKKDGKWYVEDTNRVMLDDDILTLWNSNLSHNYINKAGVEGFIEKNKEYEQSKEIIEQWRKENNIQYDPEEVYSRGQGFYSSIGAYSNLELDLLFQNLLQHIQDNKKASENSLIKDSDKIIFGHPGIGKTHLKESGRKDIIDFDSDYKSKINKQFNLPEGFKARNDFQKSNKEEYQEAVRKLWVEAKNDAKRTGKKLFASDMILLREFSNDFDKVITMSKETFVNRAKQRNDYTPGLEGTEGWKNNLDKEIGKIDKSKVHSTDKYLSDLLDSSNYGFTISAFTKPIDKRLKHIEGTGDRVRFVIYPKSNHIKWAAPTDVYSGSVWDASEKVSKDKKSELIGVSFTKAPALRNINEVSPNLADIIDNLSHAYNELGIELTTNNFRIEYDDNIDYSTKKLIDNINKILDDKYGKLVKPEIKQKEFDSKYLAKEESAYGDFKTTIFNTEKEALDYKKSMEQFDDVVVRISKQVGKQPTQTKENTTSIESVKNKTLNIFDNSKYVHPELGSMDGYNNFESDEFKLDTDTFKLLYNVDKKTYNVVKKFPNYWQAVTKSNLEYYSNIKGVQVSKIIEEQKKLLNEKIEEYNKKEYTSQALTNLKIAALKEVARRYPRSLITSKVVPINPNMVDNSEIQYSKKQGYYPNLITDEYGNTWNQVDITADNLKGILLNKMSAKNIPVTVAENSSEIENITKKWLAVAGIKFEEVDQVVGRNGDPIDAFGKADLLNKVVQVVRGDMGKQALPEEAAHMLVQILKENGNPLYGAMLKKVPSLPIYKQVFEDYSDVYGGDTLKIAEEAMGKIIGNNLKGGDIENAWFERVWNWVKSTFKKMFGISSDLAPFMEASNIILRGENVGELIGTDAEYYKLNSNPDKQAAVIKTLEGLSSELIGKTEGGLYKTKSGKVIGSRVTNLVQMYRMRAIKDSTFTQDDAYINYMAKRGTVNHLFNQAIMNDLETGGVKPMEHYISVVKAEIDKSPEFEKGSNLYNISRESFRGLVNGVTHLHTHIKQKDPGAKIITEQVVANRELNLAGTIDVLVVHSDGSASIYDYKTKNFKPVLDENKKVTTYHGIGEFTEDLYSEQISHYKNILKDLGVSVFRETRIIPIHAPFKWDYQNSKATPSAPVDMWIPEYGKEKDYLNHLPVSGEKTDYKAANEMLEKMFLAKARIKQALKKDYDNPKAKAHLDRLNKAIKRIQLDTDITGTFEDLQAAFKTIDSDVSRQDLSISEIKDLLDYLGLYSNISSVYMETAKELASDLTDAEMKQLRLKCMSYSTAIQTRTDILNREIIERLDQMGSEAVEIDPQTGDIKVKDAIEQGFLGSLFNGMGDISNPIFQDARKAVAVAAEHRKIQFEEKRAKLTELDSKFSSAASLLGYSGINTYDLMYNETGDGLTTKLDKKFYEDRKLAYKTKNLHWFKEYTYFDKEGFEKFKADKLAAINNPENAYTEADKKRELAYINGLDVESDFEKIANPKNKFVKPKPDIDYKDYINKKWKTIQDNADLKGLYDFWVDFIAEMKEQDSSIANNFIPKIRMSMLESVGKLGIDALSIAGGKGALKNALTVRQQDSMVGAINDDGTPDFRVPLLYTDNVREPLSSKEHQDVVEAAINKYKKAFDTKLSDDAIQNTHEFNTLLKSEVEYAEIKKGKKMVSKDFSSTAMLMMDSFYNYKHMKSVEERILALKSLFAAQNTVVTDKFGRKVENPITKEWRNKLGVSTDEELFDKLTNAIIYGQRVQSKDSTVEVFGQNISMNKALGTANQYMTALSLALSPVLATSNYLGGKFNAYYTGKEGVFYTGKQLMEADKKITTRDKDTYAIIDYFLPYGRTKTSEFALGVSKASMIEKGTSTDNLLTLHNIGDDNVDESVFVAMMDNWVIDSDGQLKSKGSKTYKLKDQNAKTVREHFSVVDGKVKTTLSVEQQAQFRSIVNKAINSIKGTVTNDSLAAINTTILGQLLIKFRTWMPGVIRARWKDTGVDLITNEVDIGRFRVVTQEMFSSVPGMIKTMTQLSAEVGTFGVYKQKPNPEICKKYYEKFLSENPSIDRNEFTLDNYIEMRKQKLGALANELRMFILVGSLVASIMQGMGWDDEDESNVITYNLYRASQRTGLELGFFFSPSNVTEILKSPIPLMRVATGFGKVIDNTFDETRDRIFGENSKHDSSGLFHYTAKQIPIVNSVNSTLKNIVDLIDDDKSMEELLLGE